MYREQSHSYLLAVCGAVLIASVICAESHEIQHDLSNNHPNEEGLSSENDVMHWPWPSRKFKCPSAFGAYPDPSNCAYFYICVAKFATRTRCPLMYQFCKVKRVCLPMLIAVCDDGSGEVTEINKATTQKETHFVCPEEKGKFPYPHDCAKYYSCQNDQATLETCPDSELFDGVKRKCKPAEKVHCGSRWRPTDATPLLDTTQETFTPSPDVSTDVETETIDEEITSSPEEISTQQEETTTPQVETTTHQVETTTPQMETTTPQVETTTPQEETTTPKPRVTAPDTDCDADDLDCIIDDLGLTPDWFVCPDDLGSYPHPTSNKLFIFCVNWKPLVKKCGQDLVFSEDHMTCVSP